MKHHDLPEPVFGNLAERCFKMDNYKIMVDIPQGYLHGFPKEVPEEFLEWTGEKYHFKDLEGYHKWMEGLVGEVKGSVRFYRIPAGGEE